MAEAFVSLIYLTVLSAIVETFLPEGKLSGMVGGIFGMVAVGVILSLLISVTRLFYK